MNDIMDNNYKEDDENFRERGIAHEAIKNAVRDAKEVLSIAEVAMAITIGLFDWHGDGMNQKDFMLALMRELGEQTGEPVEVVNKADDHKEVPF